MRQVRFSELAHFHPKQIQATSDADSCRFFLFGGSRGPGKSFWLRWYLIRCLLKFAAGGHRNVQVMLACEDYPSLTDRHVNKIKAEVPAWLGWVGKQQDRGFGFHLYEQFGSGSILLRNLDNVAKYQSAEFAIIAIDELVKNTLETFNILRGSMRWPGIPNCRFIAATNPAGNWVRRYWIEKRFPPEMQPYAKQFKFLAALPDDNPSLDPSYWTMLETLPDGLREAWRYGDWYSSATGLVYQNFTKQNILDDDFKVLPDVPIELTCDDGYMDARAWLFIQRTGRAIYVVDEIYESQVLEDEHIKEVVTRLANSPVFEGWREARDSYLPEICVCSHEAVQLRARLRAAQIVARNWFAQQHRAKKPRATAIKMTRGLLCDGKKVRQIFIHPRCESLIDELSMNYKLKKKTDGDWSEKPEDGNDHAAQALEGYVFSRCRDIAQVYASA